MSHVCIQIQIEKASRILESPLSCCYCFVYSTAYWARGPVLTGPPQILKIEWKTPTHETFTRPFKNFVTLGGGIVLSETASPQNNLRNIIPRVT